MTILQIVLNGTEIYNLLDPWQVNDPNSIFVSSFLQNASLCGNFDSTCLGDNILIIMIGL